MSRRRSRAADPSGTHRIAACRSGAGLVVTAALLLAPLAACSSGSGPTARGPDAPTDRATTTTTTPASASAYIAALAEGGAAGALKMAAAAAPGSPARQYAELLARLVGLGVALPAPWSTTTPVPPASTTTPAAAAAPSSTSGPRPDGPTSAPAAPTAPVGPTPGSPGSPGAPGAPPSTAPPPPRVETDGDAFRICSGARCERYDRLTFTDGLVADLHRGGRPLTDQFAGPGERVTRDGVTAQLAGAALDALGRLVVVVRTDNGSKTRWNLGYVQRHSAPGGPEHDNAGVALGPSALDPGQAADLGLPFPGASLGGTVHITTFLGSVSDPAAEVVYFDLPLR